MTILIGFVLAGFPMPDIIKAKGVFAGKGEVTKVKIDLTSPVGI